MASPYGVSQTHSLDTPQSVALLWTGDQPDAQASTWKKQLSLETNIHAPGGIRSHSPIKRAAAIRHSGPSGH